MDDIRFEQCAFDLIGGLAEKYPCYFVAGNHEYWRHDVNYVIDRISESGIKVLDSMAESVDFGEDTFILAGIADPDKEKFTPESVYTRKALEHLSLDEMLSEDKDELMVLLAHRPEYMELYEEYPIDLVLAGHAHGGQVRIPGLLNGLYAPNQGFLPKYTGGTYRCGEMTMIVNRGLSLRPVVPRIFNPPEVVIVDIIGGKE